MEFVEIIILSCLGGVPDDTTAAAYDPTWQTDVILRLKVAIAFQVIARSELTQTTTETRTSGNAVAVGCGKFVDVQPSRIRLIFLLRT